MKIKTYAVYYNGDKEKQFFLKKKAKKYVDYLKKYSFNERDVILYRREYIYVWYSDTIYGSISWFNTRSYRYIFNIWFNGKFIIWKEVSYESWIQRLCSNTKWL